MQFPAFVALSIPRNAQIENALFSQVRLSGPKFKDNQATGCVGNGEPGIKEYGLMQCRPRNVRRTKLVKDIFIPTIAEMRGIPMGSIMYFCAFRGGDERDGTL